MGELKTAAPAMAVQKLPVTDPDAFALPSVANQVIYEDIFGEDQNVSVRYSVSLNKIEEDILITAPTEMTSFSMQIECAGLTPVLNDDNSVDFLDNDGNMVYHISVPYLADAAGAISYGVHVKLTEQDETCTVTYTPDAAWMNASEREYPIMLDPAVTTREYESAISDTYVESNTQTCHLNEQYLRISQDDGVQRVALLRFNQMPIIDESMPIISATLNTCSFDWRLSCNSSASALNNFVEENEYDKVILVCHSTGGLVGSAYIALGEKQEGTVEKIISLGVPYLGTIVVPAVCMTGDIELFYQLFNFKDGSLADQIAAALIRNIVVRLLISNYKSIYELMPNSRYLLDIGVFIDNENRNFNNYDDLVAFVSQHINGFNTSHMADAVDFHLSLYQGGVHVTYLVNSTYVYSKDIDMIISICHDCSNWLTCNREYEINYSTGGTGDGVVHADSATIGGLICADRFFELTNMTHMSMVELDCVKLLEILHHRA